MAKEREEQSPDEEVDDAILDAVWDELNAKWAEEDK